MDMDMVAVGSVVTFMPALRVRNILFVIKSHVTLCYPRTLRPWLPLSVVGSEAIALSYGPTVAPDQNRNAAPFLSRLIICQPSGCVLLSELRVSFSSAVGSQPSYNIC